MTDLLPAGAVVRLGDAQPGDVRPDDRPVGRGDGRTSAPQTLVIVATVASPSPQTNTATITGADQFDPIIANNTAAVVETPQLADLALSKTVDDPTPNVGDDHRLHGHARQQRPE